MSVVLTESADDTLWHHFRIAALFHHDVMILWIRYCMLLCIVISALFKSSNRIKYFFELSSNPYHRHYIRKIRKANPRVMLFNLEDLWHHTRREIALQEDKNVANKILYWTEGRIQRRVRVRVREVEWKSSRPPVACSGQINAYSAAERQMIVLWIWSGSLLATYFYQLKDVTWHVAWARATRVASRLSCTKQKRSILPSLVTRVTSANLPHLSPWFFRGVCRRSLGGSIEGHDRWYTVVR